MLLIVKGRRAQSVLEYAGLIAAVAAALVLMATYLSRSFQGRYREVADEVSSQYEPGATVVDHTVITTSSSEDYQRDMDSDPADYETSVNYSRSTVIEDMTQRVPARK